MNETNTNASETMTTRFANAIVLGEWPTGSPEWLAARKLGASTIHKLAQYARWREDPHGVPVPKYTPWDVYQDIVDPGEREDKYVFRRGNALEPEIVDWLSRSIDGLVPFKASLCHFEHQWMTCNLDAVSTIALPDLIAEIKDFGKHRAGDFRHGAPDDLRDQLHWQRMILDVKVDMVGGVSIGGAEPGMYPVEWEQSRADFLFEVGHDFWCNHVEPRNPPEPDYSDACAEAMMAGWGDEEPPDKGADGEMGEAAIRLALEVDRHKRDIVLAKAQQATAKTALGELVAGHKRLVSTGGIKATQVWRDYIDWSTMCKEHPEETDKYRTKLNESKLKTERADLVAQYTYRKPSHVLVTVPKVKK